MDARRRIIGGFVSGSSGGVIEPIDTDDYLTIYALENGLMASLSNNACEYCIDGDGNWLSLDAGATTQSINNGQRLSFRGELTPSGITGIGTFTISKRCNLEGNCMSMLFGDDAADNLSLSNKKYAFIKLFYQCSNIVNVSENFLPATTISDSCYSNMFNGCSNLTSAPTLPATTMANGCYQNMFSGCTKLTIAPVLPATTLAPSCYLSMFNGCTSLTSAPALPATTLISMCYNSMFMNCTSLTAAPALPATTLISRCYEQMFYGCTSLTTAPTLPATTLADYCYYNMFYGCTSLTSVPTLPATTLADSCYYGMFQNCSSLTAAPELPATTLAGSCYRNMFRNCTNLTTAPELLATTLVSLCYFCMFQDCTKLNYIKMLATDVSASNCLGYWVNNVASSGTFVKDPNMTSLPTGADGIPEGWIVVNEGDSESSITDNYLTIYALEDGLTASLSTNACEYCVDGDGNWKSLAADTVTESINAGHRLSFRGELTPAEYTGIGTFTISKRCNLEGNCMSMLFGDNATNNLSLAGKDYAFYELFYYCDNIVSVSENFLPATTLADSCYSYMFVDCSGLTTAPALPATTLANSCYNRMFHECTSLTTAPELPATILAYDCYGSMFNGCSSLTTAPELPATILADYCYQNMFYGCTSLTIAPELSATVLAKYCYRYMFYGCTSLTTAPELPATTLATYCYNSMFNGCTSLTTAPELPATTLASNCYQHMFQGCTNLTIAPELPATTLAYHCYYYMFRNCKNLNYIKMLATDISATECLSEWVNNVASTGTFVKNINMTTLPAGSSGIPSGWTINDNYTPTSCTSLTITADDVSGKDTTTTIYYTAVTNGKDSTGNIINNVTVTGTTTSASFAQNTSTTNTVQRTISYTYLGKTATTTITQGVWVNSYYTIDLNNQWQKSTSVSNPDATEYDGVYESFSNYNINNTAAIMKVTIDGYSSFKFYIRSSAESNYDYVMVSQLDQTINNSTSYSNTTLVKAHTRGNQQSGTALSNYTLVEFTNIDGGKHVITIVYRKDGSSHQAADKGYVLLPKTAGESGGSGGDSGESGDINNYLTIVALEDGLTASLSRNACEYCIDGDGNWLSLASGTTTQSVNAGHTLSFRGNLTPASSAGIGTFTISKKCNLEGNCMSMLFGDNAADNLSLSGKNDAFYRLFYSCRAIVSVSNNFLPATTLSDYCYCGMFWGCSKLTSAPALPATTLTDYCYCSMFSDCSSLTSAPVLPATMLANHCYSSMFSNCSSLTSAPALPATTLASNCYYQMFWGCSKLTSAPALPATTLTDYCYYKMFGGCHSLTSVTLPATTLASHCYYDMFEACTSLTTAPALPATTLADYCYSYMFCDCTNLTTAPDLPATTLARSCYYSMFQDCTKLNYIKMLATNISATNCLSYWVYGVASTGTFVKNPNMTSLSTATSSNKYAGIPSGWTVVNDAEDGGGDANEITFYIESINPDVGVLERKATSGMTWEDWVQSDFNLMYENIEDNGFSSQYFEIIDNDIYHYDEGWCVAYVNNGVAQPVKSTDIIEENFIYIGA